MMKRIEWWLSAALMGTLVACAGSDGAEDGDTTAAAEDAVTATAAVRPLPAELARMKDFVDRRLDRAGVRRTLQTGGGRRVDCVELAAQPALRGSLVHGRQLEQPPQELDGARSIAPATDRARPEPLFELGAQGLAQAQVQCPDGTVPIPDLTLADVSRFATLDDFLSKTRAPVDGNGIEPPHVGPTSLHQYAHAYRYVTNWGAETSISINRMYTELSSEFSLGQIWVVAGSGAGLQTLEGGLQHYRDLYGDDNPHLFIYSTRGNYAPGTGCYNNTCGDFVQVSSTWYPAMGIGPVSTIGGSQYEINMHWAKAGDTGSWWLSVQGEWVGYYPRSLYTAAANHASVIDYGGEIIDRQTGGRHTLTDMGSGEFAAAGWTRAAFMRLIRYNDSNPSGNGITWAEASGLTPTQSDAACYSIWLTPYEDASWHWYFWYGGPGYANPACL